MQADDRPPPPAPEKVECVSPTPETLSVRLDGLRDLLDERFSSQNTALKLQAQLLEQRIDALTHTIEDLARRLDTLEQARANEEGKSDGKVWALGVVVTAVQIGLHFWR